MPGNSQFIQCYRYEQEKEISTPFMRAASQRFPYKGCCSGNTDTIMSSGRQCIERLALTARLTVKGPQKALSQSNIVKDQNSLH